MIQIFFEAILPTIVVAALAAWALVIVGRLTGHRVALWSAQRRTLAARRRYAGEHSAARARAVTAARDAIAATITELASRPATYSTFPPDVRERLHDAHTQSALLETGDPS